jgi:hypothetical protein
MKTFAPPPSQRRFDAGYECELPPGVRAELISPRRPPILPTEDPSVRCRIPKPESKDAFYFVLTICLITLAGALYTSWRQWETTRVKTKSAISQTVAPQPAPTPTPRPGGWQTSSAGNPPVPRALLVKPAPRAALVKLPPPRAQLAGDLPPLVPGRLYLATMPYDNLEVIATFRGWLPSQHDLPSHPNQIGDMYLVKGIPFVWLFAPGATHADWIDP